MSSTSRTILRSYGTVLILWTLVLLLPIVSPAQVPLDQSVTQPVDAALGLVQGTAKPKPKSISAPEIDVDAAAGVFIIAAGTLLEWASSRELVSAGSRGHPASTDARHPVSFGDGSHADKRGTKNPVAQQGRISQHQPWLCGRRFVLLMAAWDGYRLPVGFRLLLPKHHVGYRSENALFREMVGACVPPSWATLVSVGGAAAYGSKANMAMGKDRDKADPARRWGFGCAIARTWKPVEEKSVTKLVTPVPHKYSPCTRVPRAHGRKGRKTFWTYSTRLGLRHGGDVTVVLSKNGRNLGPQQTKLLVTNLAALTPSPVVCIDQKRWAIARMNWERTSGLGLGEHQGSGDSNRSEQSMGIAVLAYLLVLRVCHHEIVPGQPWSIVQLQQTRRLRAMTNQAEHKVKMQMAKACKAA
jgi:hypothetical protein